MRTISLTLTVLCGALALVACKRNDVPVPGNLAPPADVVASTPAKLAGPGADDNLNAVLWVQASSEYRALSEQTYRAAADHLDKALAEKHWDALVTG